jgi:hypothetical protein
MPGQAPDPGCTSDAGCRPLRFGASPTRSQSAWMTSVSAEYLGIYCSTSAHAASAVADTSKNTAVYAPMRPLLNSVVDSSLPAPPGAAAGKFFLKQAPFAVSSPELKLEHVKPSYAILDAFHRERACTATVAGPARGACLQRAGTVHAGPAVDSGLFISPFSEMS